MKIEDFNFNTPVCAYQCTDLASEIHELLGGRTANKKVGDRATCIKNHIQLPLCRKHHSYFESKKKESFIIGCEILGIENYSTYRAVQEKDEIALAKIKEKTTLYYKNKYGVDE
jgi:hypothetical protein